MSKKRSTAIAASKKVDWKTISTGEIWRPKNKGETLEGVICSQQTGYDKKNAMEFPAVTVQNSSGLYSVRTDRAKTASLNQLKIGTPVRILYHGKKRVNNLAPMLDFEVSIPANVELASDWTNGRFARKSSGKRGKARRK